MRRCGDAGGEVNVVADVALFVQQRLARVHADPHPDRPAPQAPRATPAAATAPGTLEKGEEEGIPLSIDLHPALGRAGLARRSAGAPPAPPRSLRTQLVQELRRALDVGEEEGDGSGREISPAHQRGSVARRSGCVKLALNPIFIVEFCDSGNRKVR